MTTRLPLRDQPARTAAAHRPAHHPLWLSVLLHLGPGAVATLAYLSLLPLVRSWGLPSVAALSLSVLVAVAPTQLTVLALHARRHCGPGETTIVLRERMSGPALAVWTTVVALAAAAAFAATRPLSAWVEASAFAWWPQQWKVDLGTHGAHSRSALIWTSVLILVATVVVAPVVEELYFRGFLLPRLPEHLGHGAPLAHAALFAGYHLWTPWLGPTRLLAILPLVYVAKHTRSIRPGITAHITLNAVDLVVLVVAITATS